MAGFKKFFRTIFYKKLHPIFIQLLFDSRSELGAIVTNLLIKNLTNLEDYPELDSAIMNLQINKIRIWGNKERIKISPTAFVENTFFNTSSGHIEIGDYTFTGHNVSIITGTHNYDLLLKERMMNFPISGNDIVIGNGVWICSNATILGPCKIGDHAVIAAGAVVVNDVPPCTIVAGVPAKPIKKIEENKQTFK